MIDLQRNAEDAARVLLETEGKTAVKSAAKDAINGGDSVSASGDYTMAVDAFWRLRTRRGIPAVRDVLYCLSVGCEDV